MRGKSIDATRGPIFSQFIMFALPIAIGGIVQSLFNSADMIVLGNFASSVHVASVGATTVIISLLVQTCIGLSGGAQVVLSQAFGENNGDKIRKATNTTLWIAVILGVAVTAASIPLSGELLRLTKCPEECFDDAALYMKIYFASTPAIMIYNYGGAVIRSSGDSQRPLYYLIASGLLNVVMNFILCIVMPNKVMAVAVATLLSQVLGAVLVIVRLMRIDGPCRLSLRGFLPDGESCVKILLFGVPCALTTAIYPISNLQIQSAINSYGASATAGNASATSIEGIVTCFNSASGTSVLTFVGQNYGAKKPDRINETVKKSLLSGLVTGLLLGNACVLLGRYALRIFLPDDASAVEFGMVRLSYLMTLFFVCMLNGVLTNTLNAFGYSAACTLNSVLTVLVFRVIWMATVYPRFTTFENLFLCYAVSWLLSLVVNIILIVIIYPRVMKRIKGRAEAPTQ